MSVMKAHIMKLQLKEFVHRGLIEELPGPFSSMLREHETERRFRDLESNVVYRLTEYYALSGPDEMLEESFRRENSAARFNKQNQIIFIIE